jgi:hypothetical protein
VTSLRYGRSANSQFQNYLKLIVARSLAFGKSVVAHRLGRLILFFVLTSPFLRALAARYLPGKAS